MNREIKMLAQWVKFDNSFQEFLQILDKKDDPRSIITKYAKDEDIES